MSAARRGSLPGVFRAVVLAALAAVSPAAPASAAFGHNKVVTGGFRWRLVRTAHFDLYHLEGTEPLLPTAARLAERAYDRLTRRLHVVPAERVSLFIFPDHNTFEQNNVADVGEGTGGVTEAFKNRIVLFNGGTAFWLDHVVTHEFTHVLQFEALYGGFWKSARLLKSPLYPLWVMEGLAEYGIGEIDRAEEDMYLRDAALDRALYPLSELHGFNHLKPHQVTLGYKSGASFIRFLAREYGEDVPEKLLKGMRDRFDASGVAADLARQDFGSLDARWREYLSDYYSAQRVRLGLREPDEYGRPLTRSGFLPSFDQKPVLSPDGKSVAFLTDRNGPTEAAVASLETGVTRFPAGRQWGRLENIHDTGRALSFSADGRWLAFAGEKEQRDYLYLCDLKRGRLRRVRTPFQQVRSPVFHPAEDKLAVVGMAGGVNDLYEITPRGKVIRRLTDTLVDEDDPAWSPDGKILALSVEAAEPDGYGRDLAEIDLKTLALRRLTDLPGAESSPAWTPDGKSLVFTGESLEGVRNLYRWDRSDGRTTLLTRVIGGAFSPDISRDGDRMVFSSYRHNSHQVYWAGPELWKPKAPPPQAAAPAPRKPGPPAGGFDVFSASPPAGETAPYRFRASTDLFFPLLYYSSQDGFFTAMLWQASEHLGNHQLQGSLQYGSGEDFVDYQLQYLYKRFRPQFVLSTGGETFYQDFSRIQQRREWSRAAGVLYPLDRFQRLEVFASLVHREDRFQGVFSPLNTLERENSASVSYVRDTSTGRYLSVTDGSRFRLTRTAARRVAGGTRDYDASQLELHRFIPTGGESAFAVRGIAGTSSGLTPFFFRIGGGDRLRGYSRNGAENQASRYALANMEWRVPLKYLKGSVFALFPELGMKALQGTLFADVGTDATPGDRTFLNARRSRASIGAGLRVPSFILQTYPVILSMDIAKRVDKSEWTWYFTLGPEF